MTLYTGAPPIAVLAVGIKTIDEYQNLMDFHNVHKYEVLGGLHSITVRKELMAEYQGKP